MKTYTHNLYLIERTKLLEGILCQSITFTNVLGKQWGGSTNDPISALTYKNIDIAKLSPMEEYNLQNNITNK